MGDSVNAQSGPKLPRRAGRPRSEESRASILDAAYRSLQRAPVSEISIIHIARKAGVSTATVYRWWSTKEALLLDAFLHTIEHVVVLRREGPPLERLREYILQVGHFFIGANGIVAARLLTAIQDNRILRNDFLKRVYSPREKEVRATVKEAIKRGELPGNLEIDMFLDSLVGPLLARLLIRHERIDKAYVAAVFDQVVAATRA